MVLPVWDQAQNLADELPEGEGGENLVRNECGKSLALLAQVCDPGMKSGLANIFQEDSRNGEGVEG